MSIKSKIFNHGNEHESSWPPTYPENPRGLVGYIDPKTKEFKEGYPPNPNNRFGTSASIIADSMPASYHEGAGRVVESRGEWDRLDKEHNTLTFGSIAEPRKHMKKAAKDETKALKQDRRKASLAALEMVRSNPQEIHQKVEKQAEQQMEEAKKSGLDVALAEQGIKL